MKTEQESLSRAAKLGITPELMVKVDLHNQITTAKFLEELSLAREQSGLTPEEATALLGSSFEKIETKDPRTLTLGELQRYAAAVGVAFDLGLKK